MPTPWKKDSCHCLLFRAAMCNVTQVSCCKTDRKKCQLHIFILMTANVVVSWKFNLDPKNPVLATLALVYLFSPRVRYGTVRCVISIVEMAKNTPATKERTKNNLECFHCVGFKWDFRFRIPPLHPTFLFLACARTQVRPSWVRRQRLNLKFYREPGVAAESMVQQQRAPLNKFCSRMKLSIFLSSWRKSWPRNQHHLFRST